MKNGEKPIANPLVVLREEFDDWAILFDPDTGNAFGLSPTGVYVWKLLDGGHTLDALLQKIREHAEDVPGEASDHIRTFVDELVVKGLAGFDITESALGSDQEKYSFHPPGLLSKAKMQYGPPTLVGLNGLERVRGVCCGNGSSPGGYYSCSAGDDTGTPSDCGQGQSTEECHGGGTVGCFAPCVYTYGCCHGPSATPECHGGSTPSSACNSGSTAATCTGGTST
jgi:SynChlorMet cassette protein ScmD